MPPRLLLVLALAAACRSAPDTTLASRLRARLAPAHPDWTLTERDPLSVDVTLPDKTLLKLSLDNVNAACTASPPDCDGALGQLAKAVEEAMARRAAKPKPTPESLRVLVRDDTYLRAFEKASADVPAEKREQNRLVERPLVGDLHVFLAIDTQETREMLTRDALAELGLDADAAYARALANFRELAPKLEGEAMDDVIAVDPDDDDTASLLLLPDRWAPIAAKFGGKLLVAAPARRVLLYVDGRAPDAERHLRTAAARLWSKLDHPISEGVLRWTPTGWEAVPR